ncbi:diguanylate cyclase [Fusibacter sp. JL216-2]|uniref:GGDEF domain-containing protein n=1 Tax=Fusibacter sp. JL216-2 TaxID=3071453 RepID=UPI003D34EAF9
MSSYYEKLIMKMPLAYARHRIVYDHYGNATDYEFLDMNPMFEKLTGLKRQSVLGKRLTEAIPDIKHDQTDWIATYASVVKNDKPITFTTHVASLDAHYQITAFKMAINEFVTIFEDVSSHVHNTKCLIDANNTLKEDNRILYQKSVTDSLTNFFNHNYIRELLKEELSRSMSCSLPLTLAMIDIDHFKEINDTYGHLVGDEALAMLSDLIRKKTRRSDFIGRYGGEEFLLVLPGTDIERGNQIVDRLRSAIAEHAFVIHGHHVTMTVSCGVASYQGQSMHQLIEEADKHLYEAKRLGRNQCMCSLIS